MILLINKKDNDCTDCHTEYVESIGTTKEINLLDNMNMEKYVYDNYVFTDMYVICSSNKSEFDGYVMNLNPNTNKDLRLKITLFDKDNKEIYSFKTEIYELEFGKKRDFFSQINRDISNAYSFKIEEYQNSSFLCLFSLQNFALYGMIIVEQMVGRIK